MRILTKIDVANIGGGLNTSTAVLQKSRPQLLRFLRGYMEAIQYMKSHKDESLKIFSEIRAQSGSGDYGLPLRGDRQPR